MYAAHRTRSRPDSSDWTILSPGVPVFRTDSGQALETPWHLCFITAAAPVATRIGQPEAAALLKQRIRRVLAVARAHAYRTLVLGAWGCGAFGNDPHQTAEDFRSALADEYAGAFREVLFAIRQKESSWVSCLDGALCERGRYIRRSGSPIAR